MKEEQTINYAFAQALQPERPRPLDEEVLRGGGV